MHFAPFCHLHLHSDFSLLAGTLTLEKMLARVAELRMPAVALTDYGNLFGAVEFYSGAMKRGVKPILGAELYLCPDHAQRVSEGPRAPRYAQLVLLARNNQGWLNLMKLVSVGYLEGFYYKPRIDKKLLEQYGEGLIALSSGWNGEIEQYLQRGDRAAARDAALDYRRIFGEHNFFIEIQRHLSDRQEKLNRQLIELAHDTGIPLVASNNVHFLHGSDFDAFEAMLALQQNRTVHDDVAGHFNPECHLKSYEAMNELFADLPEAIENSVYIANRCNVDLQFGNYQLPDFIPPEGMELTDHIRQLAREGLEWRWPAILAGIPEAQKADYEKRLEFEMDVIVRMGFSGYFLIVSDFIMWAKRHDIPVGPGRGSGAGSLVAYLLGITDLDPIRYGLLFERFLNPERISMPDFDIDFCMDRRDEVIAYVTQKYGADHVSQIITYGSMKAKAVVRDVGRVLDMPLEQVNAIAKLIPNDLDATLEKALESVDKLKEMETEEPAVHKLFEVARKLEGMHRHAGKHAAGVVIGRKPLVQTAPLYKDPREEGMVVQWDMKSAEKVGLIKFDFLGLKTLTVLHKACEHVKKTLPDFDLGLLPLGDRPTFELLSRGGTAAVFQLESSGMRDLLTRIRPDCFEDIVALVALYRPGPIQSGMVDDFIERKHGRAQIVYLLPQLESILKETYGVILYQEQVMQIAQVLAGYTLGQADMLRRAMGKKNPAEMAKQRQVFLDGAAKHHAPADKAEQIFDLMEKFAGYGFNKSHSAAYALIAYQTAWLKAHFPVAFMAATFSCDMGNSDKVAGLVQDCRAMEIPILPPQVNASDWEFRPEGQAIRFGLGAVKGVGEGAIVELVKAREAGGKFSSLDDLLQRLPSGAANKRVLEALIKSGALNAIIPHPASALAGLGEAMEQANRRRKELATRQSFLFGAAEPEPGGNLPEVTPWSLGEALQFEREVLGFYLSGHPLEEVLGRIDGIGDANLGQIGTLPDGAQIVLPVGVGNIRTHKAARGTMAFIQLEDLHGTAELVCFSRLYESARAALEADKPLLLAAKVDRSKEQPALLAEAIALLDDLLPELAERVVVTAGTLSWDAQKVAGLRQLAAEQPGKMRLELHVRLPDGSMAEMLSEPMLAWNEVTRRWFDAAFGHASVRLRCRLWQPPREERRARSHHGQLSRV